MTKRSRSLYGAEKPNRSTLKQGCGGCRVRSESIIMSGVRENTKLDYTTRYLLYTEGPEERTTC